MTTTLSKRENGNLVPFMGNLVNNLFEDSLQSILGHNFWADSSVSNVPVNIRETEKDYQIDVVAPGCRKQDFKINMDQKLLTVSFSMEQADSDNERLAWARNEYAPRSFTKTFTVDDSVDVDKITATYQDGILRISLGKNAQQKNSGRQIEIK